MLRVILFMWIGLLGMAGLPTADVGANGPVSCGENAVTEGQEALQPCRDALLASPGDRELARVVADLEFRFGDSARSAELWGALLTNGWEADLARGQAMALWRDGRPQEAEPLFREILRRLPSAEASLDLVRFLLVTNRPADAAAAAGSGSNSHPANCELEESWGEALAAMDDDANAAIHFARAVEKGCPPFRWTGIGRVPGKLDDPAYRELLSPVALTANLDELDDAECRARFELLRATMVPEVAPAVTTQVLNRRTAEVRLAGIGVLAVVGSRAVDSWRRLLESDDFVLRKQTLREIRDLHDRGFAPILEIQLDREPLPGNRNLVALALGELLLDGDDSARGEALLEGIPANDPSYPSARLTLLERAESLGDDEAARAFLMNIRAAAPNFWIDPELESRVRAAAAVEAPTGPPPTPETGGSGVE